MKHFMLDIETLGTKPGSVIASIGAVEFDPIRGTIAAETGFHVTLNLAPQINLGANIDGDTVKWWMEQSEDARRIFLCPSDHPRRAVVNLRDFMGDKEKRVWANSPSFDCALVENLCDRLGMHYPWTFREPRDMRTVMDLAGLSGRDFQHGTLHNALDDAIAQARAVCAAYKKLGLAELAP